MFGKPECDVLQPESHSGEACITLSHKGLTNVNIQKECYIVIVIYCRTTGYCKGGNFNFHIWAWFGYFNCSRMEIRFYPLVKRLKVARAFHESPVR